MAQYFDADAISEFKEAFSLINRNGDGMVSPQQLAGAMRSFGFNPSQAEVEDMMRLVDDDGDNTLDFTEFLNFMGQQIHEHPDLNQLAMEEAFTFFDKDKGGSVDTNEIKMIFRNFGQEVRDQEINQIISMIDVDGNGELDYEEFVALMTGGSYQGKKK